MSASSQPAAKAYHPGTLAQNSRQKFLLVYSPSEGTHGKIPFFGSSTAVPSLSNELHGGVPTFSSVYLADDRLRKKTSSDPSVCCLQ